jgi:hypothetical protein
VNSLELLVGNDQFIPCDDTITVCIYNFKLSCKVIFLFLGQKELGKEGQHALLKASTRCEVVDI